VEKKKAKHWLIEKENKRMEAEKWYNLHSSHVSPSELHPFLQNTRPTNIEIWAELENCCIEWNWKNKTAKWKRKNEYWHGSLVMAAYLSVHCFPHGDAHCCGIILRCYSLYSFFSQTKQNMEWEGKPTKESYSIIMLISLMMHKL
jgi:hypothetical protein